MIKLLSWVSMVLSPPTPQIPGRCYLNVELAGTVLNTLFCLFNCAESDWVADLVQVVAKLATPPADSAQNACLLFGSLTSIARV